jgi:hypothetical protein
VNPLNGRKGLFVNPQFTRRIVGLGHVESDNLLRLLFEQGGQPEFTVRRQAVTWRCGTTGPSGTAASKIWSTASSASRTACS